MLKLPSKNYIYKTSTCETKIVPTLFGELEVMV